MLYARHKTEEGACKRSNCSRCAPLSGRSQYLLCPNKVVQGLNDASAGLQKRESMGNHLHPASDLSLPSLLSAPSAFRLRSGARRPPALRTGPLDSDGSSAGQAYLDEAWPAPPFPGPDDVRPQYIVNAIHELRVIVGLHACRTVCSCVASHT